MATVVKPLPTDSPLHLAGRRRWGEDVIRLLLLSCALVSVVTTLAIVASLLEPTLAFFGEISPIKFFTGREWAPL
ncbi:MAG: hypothetical protein ACRDRT_16940, partial [Pseudonocardiaceae bacterium]